MGEGEALRIVRSAARAGVRHIGLSGGEVFLRPDIFSILEEIHKSGISASIVSNGLFLDQKAIERLYRLHTYLIISLDGADKKTHEEIRGEGTWERVMGSLQMLRKSSLPFSLIMSLSKINIHQVRDFILLARRLSARSVCFIPVIASGRATKEIVPSPSQIVQAIAQADEVAAMLSFPISFWCTPFYRLIAKSRYVYGYSCRKSMTMDIDPKGRVLLCDVLDIEIGDVRGREVAEVWREQESHPLVLALSEPLLGEPCLSCHIKGSCLGGCFARAYIEGDIYLPDPLCPKVSGCI